MTRFHYGSTKSGDLLYLLQYRISDPFFFLEHAGKQYAFLSSLDIGAVNECGNSDVIAVEVAPLKEEAKKREGDNVGNLAKVILETYGIVDEVHVPATFSVALADFLRSQKVELRVLQEWCPERKVKSETEIAYIRENFAHTKKAFEFVERVLQESEIDGDILRYKSEVLTSEYLKREVSKVLLDYDLENPEGLIISCGKHAAMPHHEGVGPIRPHETIIVDIFPQSTKNHYFADMTRTYVKGTPLPEITKMYGAVQEAQRASLAALRPGMTGKEAYDIAAERIKASGSDVGEKGYTHSLGHGLGVAVHEPPSLGPSSNTVLEPGHVVTVEPGLYYPDIGGVRIEDTVVVTENGCENLTNYPQNWHIF